MKKSYTYEEGLAEGFRDAMSTIVRCRECIHAIHVNDHIFMTCPFRGNGLGNVPPNGFCEKGERPEAMA